MKPRTSPIWLLEFEKFKELVKNSSCIGDCLKYFNLQNKGRNNITVKQRCLEQLIDISHWKLGAKFNKGKTFTNNKKIPIDKILIQNSKYNRYNLKIRLVSDF